MHPHRSSAPPAVADQPVSGLIRTHWVLSVCVICGHEHPRGERSQHTCPACGATLIAFPLYRELTARP